MSYELASESWCEHAMRCTVDLPERVGLSWRLQFDAVDGAHHRRWHQEVKDGRVLGWAPGEIDEPDVELRWTLDHARALYRGALSGSDALAGARVVTPDRGEGAPPPLDLSETDELEDLPQIAGATLMVQYEFAAGPFGPVSFWESFDEGRVAGMGFGVTEEADVTVWITFTKMAAVRAGTISILQALEDGGRVDGDIGPLMLLAGLEESPELRAAEAACGPAGSVLAMVGELAATAPHRAAMEELARVTE